MVWELRKLRKENGCLLRSRLEIVTEDRFFSGSGAPFIGSPTFMSREASFSSAFFEMTLIIA